jgi:uncharacterized protein DUF3303
MLFLIDHKHTADLCPAGILHPDREFLMKVEEKAKSSGIRLVDAYLDGPGHHFYFVVEAEKSEQLATFITPLLTQIGESKSVPVLRWAEATSFARRIGIQK